MKKVLANIKDNIITGLIIVIPVAVIVIILAELIKKIIVITAPFTEKMALGGPVSRAIVAAIIVVVILGAFFYINGLLTKTYLGSGFKNWMEKKVYVNIPFYKTFVGVTNQITGKEKDNYQVVEVDLHGNNNKVLGLLTETLADGRYIVYTPFAPVINFGQVHIVAKENVKVLSMSIKDATEIITRIGFEANKVYKEN